MTDWNSLIKGWKSRNEVILYNEHVSWNFGWGSKITECIQLFGFCGGSDNNVLERYGCCTYSPC